MKVSGPYSEKTNDDWLVSTGGYREDGTEVVLGISPHLTEQQALDHAVRICEYAKITPGIMRIKRRGDEKALLGGVDHARKYREE